MTKAHSLLLGTAAALVTVSGAHAADLSLPATSVSYVQICSVAGFTGFLLPGSDVCFDVSGFARFEANVGDENRDYWYPSAGGDDSDEVSFNGEFELNFDARTMTEWGLLRGFVSMDSEERNDGADVEFEQAFVQIGGLVAGLTSSFFDPVYSDYALVGGFGGDDDVALLGYNFALGNGLSFGVSLEDAESRQAVIELDIATALDALSGVSATADEIVEESAYDASYTLPDVVAALRVSQAWGSAAAYAAVRSIDPEAHGVDNELGFAVGASAEVNLPFGYGSTFGVFGTYASGMVDYVDINGYDFQVVDSKAELTEAFVVGAGVDLGLTEEVSLQLEGTYAEHDAYDEELDRSLYSVRASVAYTPISNLTIAAGIAFAQSENSDAGTDLLATDGIEADDTDLIGRFRITRSF